MKIWVEDKKDINRFQQWLKSDVELCEINSGVIVPQCDYVVSTDKTKYPEAIDLQAEFDRALINVIQEFGNNYNYYALKNAIEEAKNVNISTVITGSSYALFGYDKTEIKNSVGLGLPAQDIYYSACGIYNVCAANKNINDIVVICGPYYFYTDLSKTRNTTEIKRVSKVYKPLFGDVHNCLLLEPKYDVLCDSCIWDMEKILKVYSISEYQRGFFNDDHPRFRYATKTWDKECVWLDLSIEERKIAGEKRAKAHNNNFKHNSTYAENCIILKELASFCEQNRITLSFVLAPASCYYREYVDDRFMTSFYDALNSIESEIHLLDLFSCEDFTDEDYNDSDHLSESGAKKMSMYISKYLEELRIP